ncbi:MAG: hypothetical protein K5905_01540 [Roseibium sp.]|uniref:hypothetical protein n=1 Tax=Roseibium sp. TaxID=1936156 RepID=UPI00262784B6|nr:hypothetical protein [Roseibium sp.]MCV0424133.1 hypothetical protein [Roseibium sp.]
MAILTYDKSENEVDQQVVKGKLRTLVISNLIDDQVTFCMNVDPYGEGKNVTISATVQEFAEAISGSYDFENLLANVAYLQNSDSALLKSFVPLKLMKEYQKNAIELASIFQKILDQIERELPQFNTWIACAEKKQDDSCPSDLPIHDSVDSHSS